MSASLPRDIETFLLKETPQSWVDAAQVNESVLLVDHANCERKAASSALAMIYRFVDYRDVCMSLSRIVREEMRHFEQVLSMIDRRGHTFGPLGPSRYARNLHKCAQATEGENRIAELLVAAIIEARSCERFRLLVDVLDPEVARLYERLCEAEERHFGLYLRLAHTIGEENSIQMQLETLLREDARLVTDEDDQFRFHSGPPAMAKHSNVSSD